VAPGGQYVIGFVPVNLNIPANSYVTLSLAADVISLLPSGQSNHTHTFELTGIGPDMLLQQYGVIGNPMTIAPTNGTTAACTATSDIVEGPLGNPGGTGPFEQLGLATSTHPEILQYRIQWSTGWSQWYTPGVGTLIQN